MPLQQRIHLRFLLLVQIPQEIRHTQMQLIVIVMCVLDLQRLCQPVPQPTEASLFFGSAEAQADADTDCKGREARSDETVGRLLCWGEVEILQFGDEVGCALGQAGVTVEVLGPVAWGSDAVTYAF
jgi:hypothetical protein